MPYSTRARRHDWREPELPPARILHYDPQTLRRTETPVTPVGTVCARCLRVIPRDELERDNVGNLICQDDEQCWEQQQRNLRGGW